MKVAALFLSSFVALSLGACTDRSSGDDPSAAAPIADDPVGESGENEVGDTDANPASDTDSGSLPASTPDPAPDASGATDPDTDTDTASEPMPGTDVENEDGVLVPAVPPGSDGARLLAGLRRVVGAALLDLNERLSGGVELTDQQQDCLGSYDPAFGEPLLALDCERALATGEVPIYVERGAFYTSADCTASLATGTIENCLLSSASMFIRTLFEQVPGARRPQPVAGSGVDIAYDAIDEATLRVTSDAAALTGAFDCGIDLLSGASLPGTGIGCDVRLRDVADRIDALQPVL